MEPTDTTTDKPRTADYPMAKALAECFEPAAIEWRVGSVNHDSSRCMLMPYITSRAIMNRLDAVIGPGSWQDSYAAGPGGGIMCGIGIHVAALGIERAHTDAWVWKYDAAENTDFEAIKGGISNAFKRAAVKWGIGRYLYALDNARSDILDGWANGRGIDVSAGGKHVGWCETPALPAWALPVGTVTPTATAPTSAPTPTGPPAAATDRTSRPAGTGVPACPDCGKGLWDNREDRKHGKRSPALVCKARCGWKVWEVDDAGRWLAERNGAMPLNMNASPPSDFGPPPPDDDDLIPF